jgi:Ni,Fe-hydrogenase I cytochrome b subunit
MSELSTLMTASGYFCCNSTNSSGEKTTLLSGGFLRSLIIPNFIFIFFCLPKVRVTKTFSKLFYLKSIVENLLIALLETFFKKCLNRYICFYTSLKK